MAKTYKCKYCGSRNPEKDKCPNCGKYLYGLALNSVNCSPASFRWAVVDGMVTDRFLIVRTIGFVEQFGDILFLNFGIIGAIIGELLFGLFRRLKKKKYGYYNLRDIQKAVFPFYNNKYKKPFVLRIVMKDGTDFLIGSDQKRAPMLVEALRSAGVYIENGEGRNAGAVYCSNPICSKNELGLRICPEAAAFANPGKKQKVMPPMQAETPLS